MLQEEFISKYPRLYHMAADDSWPSIQRHGLLSTSALLELFEVDFSSRWAIEAAHRPRDVVISHPRLGSAVIRDQKPMNEKMLQRCLVEMTPGEWYRTLNRKVFFWPTQKRLESLLAAYKDRRHLVLVLDSATLVERQGKEILLSHINSGATRSVEHKRGISTFKPIQDHPKGEDVAELALPTRLIDVEQFLVHREYRRYGESPHKV